MTLKNQSFVAAKAMKNSRKLDATLRQFTNDRLTEEQRLLIHAALKRRPQHSLQVYQTVEEFCQVVKERAGNADIQTLFGCPETHMDKPAAVLIRRSSKNRPSNAVYIYLPTETEE